MTLTEENRDCGVLQISHERGCDIMCVVWSHRRCEVMTVYNRRHYYKSCLQSPVHMAGRMESSPRSQIPVQDEKQLLLHCAVSRGRWGLAFGSTLLGQRCVIVIAD